VKDRRLPRVVAATQERHTRAQIEFLVAKLLQPVKRDLRIICAQRTLTLNRARSARTTRCGDGEGPYGTMTTGQALALLPETGVRKEPRSTTSPLLLWAAAQRSSIRHHHQGA
jgi:hypothetical protein